MLFRTIVLILSCSVVIFAAQNRPRDLPSFIKPCHADDPKLNKCVWDHANEAIPFLVNGDNKSHVASIDPMILEKVDLRPNNQITLKLEKVKILGLGGAKMKKPKVDLKNRHIKLPFSVANLDILAQYNMSGQIGIIPIRGQGATEIKFTGADILYEFYYKLKDGKDNKTYFGDITPSTDFKVDSAHFWFDNLYDGNKQLSDSTHDSLNKNWQEVMKIFGHPIGETMQEIATFLIKAIVYPVPFEKIFLQK